MAHSHELPERRRTRSLVIGSPCRHSTNRHRDGRARRPNGCVATLSLAQPEHGQESAEDDERLAPEDDEPTPTTPSFPREKDSWLLRNSVRHDRHPVIVERNRSSE